MTVTPEASQITEEQFGRIFGPTPSDEADQKVRERDRERIEGFNSAEAELRQEGYKKVMTISRNRLPENGRPESSQTHEDGYRLPEVKAAVDALIPSLALDDQTVSAHIYSLRAGNTRDVQLRVLYF